MLKTQICVTRPQCVKINDKDTSYEIFCIFRLRLLSQPSLLNTVNITCHLPPRIFSFFILDGFDSPSVFSKASVIENEPLLDLLQS